MAKYKFLIRVADMPDYWHDFNFSTSGDALAQADALCVSGDVYVYKNNKDEDVIVKVPGQSVQRVDIYQ